VAITTGDLAKEGSLSSRTVHSWLQVAVLVVSILGAGFTVGSKLAGDESRIGVLEQSVPKLEDRINKGDQVIDNLGREVDELHNDLIILETHMHDEDNRFPAPQSKEIHPKISNQGNNPVVSSTQSVPELATE